MRESERVHETKKTKKDVIKKWEGKKLDGVGKNTIKSWMWNLEREWMKQQHSFYLKSSNKAFSSVSKCAWCTVYKVAYLIAVFYGVWTAWQSCQRGSEPMLGPRATTVGYSSQPIEAQHVSEFDDPRTKGLGDRGDIVRVVWVPALGYVTHWVTGWPLWYCSEWSYTQTGHLGPSSVGCGQTYIIFVGLGLFPCLWKPLCLCADCLLTWPPTLTPIWGSCLCKEKCV